MAVQAQPAPGGTPPSTNGEFAPVNTFEAMVPAPRAPGQPIRFQQGNPFGSIEAPEAAPPQTTREMLEAAAGTDAATLNDFNLLTNALEARRRGDIQTARATLQQLVQRNPSNPQYQRLLRELNNPAFAQPTAPPFTPPFTVPGGPTPAQPVIITPGGDPVEEREGGRPLSLIPGEGAAPVGIAPVVDPGADAVMINLDALDLDFDFDSEDFGKIGLKELKNKLKRAKEALKQAMRLRKDGEFAESNVLLSEIKQSLEATGGEEATKILEAVNYELGHMLLYKAADDMERGLFEISTKAIEDFENKEGGPTKESMHLRNRLQKYQLDPHRLSIDKVSPGFIDEQADLHNLLIRARTQMVNGDRDGAMATYREIELRYPNSPEAKYYQTLIAEELHRISYMDRRRTRELLLAEISTGWALPQVIDRELDESAGVDPDENPIAAKLKGITIPKITLSNVELTRAIEFLSEASVRYDFTGTEPKGVNIIPVFDPNEVNPRVNINARNLTLERVLEVLTDQVNFDFEIQEDAVVVSKSKTKSGDRNYIMEFFPITRPTVLKLTGGAVGNPGGGGGMGDPFAGPPGGGAGLGGGGGGEEQALKDFFIRAGVPLDDPDSSFAFDGTQLIVRHSQRVIQRIRDILRRYDQQQTQVEIEAKFLEVKQGSMEELGFDWTMNWGRGSPTFDSELEPILDSRGEAVMDFDTTMTPNIRNLSDAFIYSGNNSKTTLSREGEDPMEFDNPPPNLPNTLDLASTTKEFFKNIGKASILGGAEVTLLIRALQRQSGTELLSAPKVTVNDQGTANITVAQEFRYPENYDPGEISQNGSGFTGATPNSFTERMVGVELSVTPQVQANDTISLHLEPQVTEFEGFVEYGGNSVVIGGGNQGGNQGGGGGGFGGFGGGGGQQQQVVIVQPSGIYQPIFSVRRVVTDVTIYDGATVVIGGLTREEVKTVKDKVPILGNIPGLGRLFRTEGESSLKRNLMIFVTGNIISPGGGLARQNLATIQRSSMFQNPIVITPAGPERRLDPRFRRSN